MPIAKSIEISAESETSFDDAIKQGARSACDKLDNVKSIWIKDQEAQVSAAGEITLCRVWMKIVFGVK